ncbi:MAG: sulfatase family protein [Thermoguttaceae bacterium]
MKTIGLGAMTVWAALWLVVPGHAAPARPPNFIILFADDLGYGDLACYGHPTIRTPHLDRMAAEGQRWTSFYSAAPVCTPSRAALLTGRLPPRNGMCHDQRRVLFPDSTGGLPPEELTLAESLQAAGYATACVGKWHLGHRPEFLPTRHGFGSYFGIPYSNDMDRTPAAPPGREAFWQPKIEYFNVPLMRDQTIIQRPADQPTLTARYTDEVVRLIRQYRDRPFFIYLAYTFPHVPLFASPEFSGRSPRGLYGDVVEEIDASAGRIVQTLRELGLDRQTLVFFSSDNGPWLAFNEQGGSAGLLREGKGSTWEGGMRVPGIFWWPGRIRPAVVRQIGCTMDLLPTLIRLAGAKLPTDRILDGVDISPALLGTGPSPRNTMFFYRDTQLYAVRHGAFKAHLITRSGYGGEKPQTHDPPLLYNLDVDPGEKFDLARQHPEVVAQIRKIVKSHRRDMRPAASQLGP